MRVSSLPGLLILALAATADAADTPVPIEVYLVTGDIVAGERISEDDDSLVVRRTIEGVSGTVTYPKTQVTRVVRLEDAYREWLAKTPDTVPGQLDLARWCYSKSMNEQACTHARRVLALDAGNLDARTIMNAVGWVEADGKWMRREDYLAQHGLVLYCSRVMTSEQKAGLADLVAARANAQNAAERKRRALADCDATIANATNRLAAIDKERGDLQAKAKAGDAAQAKVDSAQKQLDAANDRLKKANNAGNNRNNGGYGNRGGNQGGNNNVTAAQNAQRQAQQAYNDAVTEARRTRSDGEAAKRRLADFERDAPTLRTSLDTAQKNRPQLEQEAKAAKDAADAAAKTLNDALAAVPTPSDLPAGLVPR